MDSLTRYALFCTASMSPTATPIYSNKTLYGQCGLVREGAECNECMHSSFIIVKQVLSTKNQNIPASS